MEQPPPPLLHDPVARDSWLTLACLGIVAAVLADLVHEVAGHMLVGFLDGDHMTRLSSVGLQSQGIDRLLSAAGTSANVLTGAVTLACLRHPRGAPTRTGTYFLLLFAAFNLFNSGYLVWSGIALQGDWALVIGDVSPPWLGRAVLIVAGVALYWLSCVWIGWQLERRFGTAAITRGQWYKLLVVPYLTAAAVMVGASLLNPYGSILILISGFGASAVLNYGLIAAGGHVPVSRSAADAAARTRPVNISWLLAALLAGGLFIGVLGPGIALGHTP
jgi:hypothetical protein